MYKVGELIVYGSAGVCEVTGVGAPDFTGADKNRDYYFLKPLSREGIIYAPVDTKVFMRPVISAGEAEKLIASIPSIEAEAFSAPSVRLLTEHYESALSTHNCRDLIRLTMSIYEKKRTAEQNKRRIGLVDERFMKRAENLLFGEFSAALGIPFDSVPDYIFSRVDPAPSMS